tara:strand:- start:10230 stop:11408 length:1179 start_codon:yes stop_codon:yes gene_type:complete
MPIPVSTSHLIGHPTPCYYYDVSLLDATLKEVYKHGLDKGYLVHYALKANHEPYILKKIQKAGLGADCVSGGEIQQALNNGFRPDQIAFAGVGKSDQEITLGLESDIFCFNVESLQELTVINEIAKKLQTKARVAIRLNPNIPVKTHMYITTGLNDNKFGISDEELQLVIEKLPNLSYIEFLGIHFHIGSQINHLEPFIELAKKANKYVEQIETAGFTVKVLNMGGGYGVNYKKPDNEPIPNFKAFFNVFDTHLNRRNDQEVHFELGRSIIAQSGSLLSRVLFIKERSKKTFAVIDAGMTELIRPALYQATHQIDRINSPKTKSNIQKKYDVVGPICESSDTFAQNYSLPVLQRGDLLAIRSAGAYGQVMKSQYNLRPDFPVIYSDDLDNQT